MVTKSKNRVGGMVEECAQGKFTGLSLFLLKSAEPAVRGSICFCAWGIPLRTFYDLSLALWVWEFKGTHPDQ